MYWGPTTPTRSSGNAVSARAAAPVVHLLSNYDEHVVAYRDHSHSLDPAAREAMRTRGTERLAVHLITRDGLVVGGWRRTIERTSATVTTQLLVSLSAREKAAMTAAADEYGHFLNLPVKLATTWGPL